MLKRHNFQCSYNHSILAWHPSYILLRSFITASQLLNTSPPWQNGRYFATDIFKRIFLNENFRILIQISLNFVPKGILDNNSALFQVMAWRRIGDKPLPESMLTLVTDAYMRHQGEMRYSYGKNELSHRGLNKIVAIWQLIYSNGPFWKIRFTFWLNFIEFCS